MQPVERPVHFKLATALFIVLATALSCAAAQAEDSISLELFGSSELKQGDTFVVEVKVFTSEVIRDVELITTFAVVSSTIDQTIYRYTVNTGERRPIGHWNVRAIAQLDNGATVRSELLTVYIGPKSAVSEFAASVGLGEFAYVGEFIPLRVSGKVDGRTVSLIDAQQLDVEVIDPEIAVFDTETKSIIARGYGNTVVDVRYADEVSGTTLESSVDINVRQRRVGDLNADNQVTVSDYRILEGFVERSEGTLSAESEDDSRDLTEDGVINSDDLIALASLCDFPDCHYRELWVGDPTPASLDLPTPIPTPTSTPDPTPEPTFVPSPSPSPEVLVEKLKVKQVACDPQTWTWQVTNSNPTALSGVFKVLRSTRGKGRSPRKGAPLVIERGEFSVASHGSTYIKTRRAGDFLVLSVNNQGVARRRIGKKCNWRHAGAAGAQA